MPAASSRKQTNASDAQDAKKAVDAALKYFHTLFSSLPAPEPTLEEVELSSDGKCWLVTLSYEESRRKNLDLPDFLRIPRQKLKVFHVERKTDRVVSMKMRDG